MLMVMIVVVVVVMALVTRDIYSSHSDLNIVNFNLNLPMVFSGTGKMFPLALRAQHMLPAARSATQHQVGCTDLQPPRTI